MSRQPISEELHSKLIELKKTGMTNEAVAVQLGLGNSTVARYWRLSGLDGKDELLANISELASKGMYASEIADVLGISEHRVSYYKRKLGFKGSLAFDTHRRKSEEQHKEDVRNREIEEWVHRLDEFIDTVNTYAGDDWEYDSGFVSTYHPVTLRCKHCGNTQEFNADSVRQWKKYSAPVHVACDVCTAIKEAQDDYARDSTFVHQCPVCNRWIDSANLYCSRECAYRAQLFRLNDSRKENFQSKLVKCRNCGKEFWTQFKKSKVFCSDECRKRYARHNNRVQKRMRKWRMLDAMVDDDITLEKLIERDGGICQICGRPVDINDYRYDDGNFICGHDYPSIDHVFPLSKGGKHSWNNVQLAHCYCNTLKNDNI